jgi:hypothetical protein
VCLRRRRARRIVAAALVCAALPCLPAEAARIYSFSATAHRGTLVFRLQPLRGLVIRHATLRAGHVRAGVPLWRIRAAARRGRLRIAAPAPRRRWRLRVVADSPYRTVAPPSPPSAPAPTAPPAPKTAPSTSVVAAVRTGTADEVGLTTATLTGRLDAAVGYRFEWGAAGTTPWRDGSAGPVSERVTGLAPATTYRFRIVGANGAVGEEATFTTRPDSGALFGAWHRDGGTWSAGALLGFEQAIGRRLAIDAHFTKWGDAFPAAPEAFDKAGGRLPLDSWDYIGSLDAINDGSQDAVIRAAADRVRAYDAPVLLRPWYEMNGDWWAGSYQGVYNNDPGQTNGPAKYVAAWRRLHDIFAKEGATNAVWVWSPNCSDWPAEAWNHWTNYYPGDAYVDWVACDEYNWGNPWASFRGLFGGTPSVYSDYPQKPFMVAETASCDVGGDKAAWIDDARAVIPAEFPGLRAFVWFDEHNEADCNWRVDSSPASLAAYRAMGADPYFRPADGLPDDTPAPPAPGAPAAAPGDPGAIRLSWAATEAPDVAIYRVYRQAPDGAWPGEATAWTTTPGYTDAGLTPGAAYAYRVTAVDAAGNESDPSAVATGVAGG